MILPADLDNLTPDHVDKTDGQALVDHVSGWIRTHFYTDKVDNLKSNNKPKKNENPNELAKRRLAERELIRSRGGTPPNSNGIEGLRAHNCGDLSQLADHFFREMKVATVHLLFGGEHQVAKVRQAVPH